MGTNMENDGNSRDLKSKNQRTFVVTSEIAARFEKARKELKWTQLELSNKSTVSLRTIRDLESGRRKSFSESTVVLLCRALNLDVGQILGEEQSDASMRKRVFSWWWIAGIIALFVAAGLIIWYAFGGFKKPDRIDWVFSKPITVNLIPPPWGDSDGRVVNYYKLNQTAKINQVIPVEIKWSYHCVEPSHPMYYISAFTEWDPDREIRLYEGILSGDSSEVFNLKIQAPKKPGVYRLRVFFASSFGPMSSFYGHPPDNQLYTPASAPYLEIPIEVVREKR
jgi:transcriptional regulator with XRE-family HTH domain